MESYLFTSVMHSGSLSVTLYIKIYSQKRMSPKCFASNSYIHEAFEILHFGSHVTQRQCHDRDQSKLEIAQTHAGFTWVKVNQQCKHDYSNIVGLT